MKKYRAKGKCLTLASVAQGLEHCPHNQNIVGSIPSQDTYLEVAGHPWSWGRCLHPPVQTCSAVPHPRAYPQSGCVWRWPMDASLSSLFLSLPSSLPLKKQVKMSLGEDKK